MKFRFLLQWTKTSPIILSVKHIYWVLQKASGKEMKVGCRREGQTNITENVNVNRRVKVSNTAERWNRIKTSKRSQDMERPCENSFSMARQLSRGQEEGGKSSKRAASRASADLIQTEWQRKNRAEGKKVSKNMCLQVEKGDKERLGRKGEGAPRFKKG